MAACAAYAAVLRYVTRGKDEYPIAPRNVSELRAVLYVLSPIPILPFSSLKLTELDMIGRITQRT